MIGWAALAAPAHAKIDEGVSSFVIHAGSYSPDPSVFDDEPMVGIRLCHNVSQRFGIGGELGFYSTDVELAPGVDIDFDAVFVGFSFGVSLRPAKKLMPVVYGGPGFSPNDAGLGLVDELKDDSFTLRLGGGVELDLGRNVFLRLVGRAPWHENREDDDLDRGFTAGIGWRFGE